MKTLVAMPGCKTPVNAVQFHCIVSGVGTAVAMYRTDPGSTAEHDAPERCTISLYVLLCC